jgi:hypothetical protein
MLLLVVNSLTNDDIKHSHQLLSFAGIKNRPTAQKIDGQLG